VLPLEEKTSPESDRRIRVLYLIDKLHRAGAQVHLGELLKGLDRQKFEPRVCCLIRGGPVADSLLEAGIPVDVLDLTSIYGPRAWRGLVRLIGLLRAGRVDVLHAYLVSSNIFGTIAARLARVPVVVTTRRDTGFSRNWRLRLVEEWLVNPLVDKVTAVSPSSAAVARRERCLGDGKVVTIPNGIDIQKWRPENHDRPAIRKAWGIAADEKAVGVVAGLSPVKGHDDFLRAAKLVLERHSSVKFFIIGDGVLRADLESLARTLGLGNRAVFTGARGDVPELLSMLDVSVLPSHTEGMSNALLESMAMGCPIVATAADGNVDVLGAGAGGALVPPRNAQALAEAILRLLDNPGAARAMGAAARARVADEFGLDRMVERYEGLYEALLAEKPARS
jgi:glycosyltransferase involved in cell wall biosynthesis